MIDAITVGRIQQAHKYGKSILQISRDVGVCPETVRSYISNDFSCKTITRKRAKKLVSRDQKLAKLAKSTVKKGHRQFPKFGSAARVRDEYYRQTKQKISVRQVQRCLKRSGLHPYKRQFAPTRCSRDLARRKEFAKKNVTLDPKKLAFSDETWISCNESTCRVQWAKSRSQVFPKERKARVNVNSVMVWGAVAYNWKSKLVIFPAKQTSDEGESQPFRLNGDRYVRSCLSTVVDDLKKRGIVFQHDGARAHVKSSVRSYLSRKGVRVLENWPANSPDLNMIEYLWKTLKERVGLQCPYTMDELITAVRKAWDELPQQLINNHVMHFQSALRGCLV